MTEIVINEPLLAPVLSPEWQLRNWPQLLRVTLSLPHFPEPMIRDI
jgi:hypothetical protein